MEICKIENCQNPVRTKGMCHKHYMAEWSRIKGCSVEGCGKPISSGGLCRTHRRRKELYGSTDKPIKKQKTCTIEGCNEKHFGLGFCNQHYHYNYRRHGRGKFIKSKDNARQRNLPWDLTENQFYEILGDYLCFYCNNSFEDEAGINLDRINNDPSIGYTYNNVVPCCWKCNDARGHSFSHEEFIAVSKLIKEMRKK